MINNPLEINDWEIKDFLKVVLVVQLVLPGLEWLNALGFAISVLTQIVGFIYLTFIPGLLLLRILKLHKLGIIETLLYTVGLSLTFLMLIGLLVNLVYPHIGIDKPISAWPLIGTITVAVLILSFIAYKRDKGFSTPTQFNWRRILSAPALFLISLTLLSVLGAQIVNVYHSNILLLILIALIALIPIIIIFTKFIPESLYPLAVMTVALALLYHWGLISEYLTGTDIHLEYYFANLVMTNALWDSTIANSYNGMLSVVMLAPAYSIICGMNLTWVFKIIYPLLYSLVPMGIYLVFNRQINSKISFLAAFFFIAVQTFYMEMLSLARQQVAELFLTLILLVVVTKRLNATAQKALFLIFSASLIVSHYSISYIFLFLLIAFWILRFLIQRVTHSGLKGNKLITFGIVIFFFVVAISWYMWQANSSTFANVTVLFKNIYGHIITEFMSLFASQALWLIVTPTVAPLHEVAKYLHLFMIGLIGVGMLQLVVKWRNKEFNEDYALFSVISFVIVAAAIPIPYMAIALNTTRLYHIMLIFLAPFCITGSIAIYQFVVRGRQAKAMVALKIVSSILAVFLLFNTGFVYEMVQDRPFSIALSQESIKKHGTDEAAASFYSRYTAGQEVIGSRWLSANIRDINELTVYVTFTDSNIGSHSMVSYGMIPDYKLVTLDDSTQTLANGSYVYLSYLNVIKGIGTLVTPPIGTRESFDMAVLRQVLMGTNKIYTNNGIEILLMP